MSKEVSWDDVAAAIDKVFTANRQVQEEKIDLNAYAKVVIREAMHNILCKSNNVFELWLKLKSMDNLIAITNTLEKSFPSSKFTIQEYDALSSYIKCEIHEIDAETIRAQFGKEKSRYLKRAEVLKELESTRDSMKANFGSTMTILNQKALELQEHYERKIREIRNEQAIERIKLDNLLAETPKKYQEEINCITEKIATLKKCSHGFMYDGTVFI